MIDHDQHEEETLTGHTEPTAPPPNMERARKATVYEVDGGWRYRVQGANWVNIDATEETLENLSHVYYRLASRWPQMEALVLPNGTRLEGDELEEWIQKHQTD